MRLKLKKVKYIIKTQNLVKSSGDGCIAVRDEITYNRMNEAMFKFNKSLFNPIHKSHYNDIDITILDEARTIVPLGWIWREEEMPKDIIEIDICKAFTKAFMDISKIIVFNQFDVWKACDNRFNISNHHELTMYYIKVNCLFNSIYLTLLTYYLINDITLSQDRFWKNYLKGLWRKLISYIIKSLLSYTRLIIKV